MIWGAKPLFLIALLLAGCVSSYSAVCNVAGRVHDFRGNPLFNVTVRGWVNGTDRGNTTTYEYFGEALFTLDLQGDSTEVGAIISFTVDGIEVPETSTFIHPRGDQNLTLTQGFVNHSILLNEFTAGPSGWIELYNNGSKTANIKDYELIGMRGLETQHTRTLNQGWNLVSLALDSPVESAYVIPYNKVVYPNDFALFLGVSTGINLSASSGRLFLEDPYNYSIDYLAYTSSSFNTSWSVFPFNVSVGRMTDGFSNWTFFTNPSPGASN